MKKFNENIIILISLLLSILLLGLSIYFKNIKGIFTVIIILLFFLVYFLIMFYSDYSFKIKRKKIIKKYQAIQKQDNITPFDQLYILTFQGKIEEKLREIIKHKKYKDIGLDDFEILEDNKLAFNFKYQEFYFEYLISDDKIKYKLIPPTKYQVTEFQTTNTLEQVLDFTVNDDNLVEFINRLIENVNDLKISITKFLTNYHVDEVFNGKLSNKLSALLSYIKTEGLCVIIISPIFLIILFVLLFTTIKDPNFTNNNPTEYVITVIFLTIFIGIIIGYLIYGLNYLKIYLNYQNDFKNKSTSKLTTPPKRVRLIYDQQSKWRRNGAIRYLKLYYDNMSLLIPFNGYQMINHNFNKKECYEECLEIIPNLTYLTKSKIVISGGNKYINIVTKHLGD